MLDDEGHGLPRLAGREGGRERRREGGGGEHRVLLKGTDMACHAWLGLEEEGKAEGREKGGRGSRRR